MRKWEVVHRLAGGERFSDKTIVEADDLHITQTGCLVFKRWFDVDAHSNTLVFCKIFSPNRWMEVHLQEEAGAIEGATFFGDPNAADSSDEMTYKAPEYKDPTA